MEATSIEAPPRYRATFGNHGRRWAILDGDDIGGEPVDLFMTAGAAAHAVELLNGGRAHVEPHATLGNRVVINAWSSWS